MALRFVIPVGAFLLIAGCGFEDMSSAPTEVSKTIDLLFQSIDQGTWAASYEVATTSELRQAASKEDYEKLGKAIRERLGKLGSKETRGFNVQSMNGVLSAHAQYEGQFEKGKGTIIAVLRKSEGKWFLINFKVNSPLFLESTPTTACASCGKPRPTDAAFCPGCGQKVESTIPASPAKK